MTKYLIAALALCVALLGGSGWLHLQQAKNAGVQKAEIAGWKKQNDGLVEAANRLQATLAARERQRAVTARETASLRLKLDAALAANTTWAETPVPAEVQKALEAP